MTDDDFPRGAGDPDFYGYPGENVATKASYTFKHPCDVCGQKPILRDVGMCSTCTFGERSSMWEWLDDGVCQKERKLAEKYVMEMFAEVDLIDKAGNIDPIKAMLLHIDQPVLDRIEMLL